MTRQPASISLVCRPGLFGSRLGLLLLATALTACQTGVGKTTGLTPISATTGAAANAKTPVKGAHAARISTQRPNFIDRQVLTLQPGRPAPLSPVPAEATAARAFIAVEAGANVTGSVTFQSVTDSFFGNSAANFRLFAVGPAQNTLVTVSTLADELYTRNGQVVTATSSSDGSFTLSEAVPTGKPFVVNAAFARGHRLTAIAPAGATNVAVDEGSSMITELARWQLFPFAVADEPDVTDVSTPDWTALSVATRTLLTTPDIFSFASTGGAIPSIGALQTGAGHMLRNLYVEAFGSRVNGTGASTPAVANELSDKWEDLLGFKPLALTRMVGNGIKGFDQSDGQIATEAAIRSPIDAVADHLGNVYFSQNDSNLIGFVPKANRGPLFGETGAMEAGKLYTIAGQVNGPSDAKDWDSLFYDATYRKTANPDYNLELDADEDGVDDDGDEEFLFTPPLITGDSNQGFPIMGPHKLMLERGTGDLNHLYFTLSFPGRVMMIPAEDLTDHLGVAAMQADHLYSVGGIGPFTDATDGDTWNDPVTDNQPAGQGGFYFPTGLQQDAAGNLWVLDSGNGNAGTGRIVIIRQADGLAFVIPLTQGNNPFSPDGALDLRLNDGFAYVADTDRHWVFRFPAPDMATIAAWNGGNTPAQAEIERVAGKPGVAGFIDTSVAGGLYPDIHDVSDGLDDPDGDLIADGGAVAPDGVTALLNRPGSVAFDAMGNLLIGDTGNGRIRYKQDGKLYTIAGGLDTRYLSGDSRLAYLPATAYLNLDATDNSLLVTDRREALVRRLHTQRGTLKRPVI